MIFHFNKDANNFPYTIRIPWKSGDTVSNWNDICAWAVETFGLPGDKFITHPTEDYMDFMFRNSEDAVHFSLACE
jgi:hypothetical protein